MKREAINLVKNGKVIRTINVAEMNAEEKKRFYLTLVKKYCNLGYEVNWA